LYLKYLTNFVVDLAAEIMCCKRWWLVTVIRGDVATPNKDFMKTKKHHVFRGGADCYTYGHFYDQKRLDNMTLFFRKYDFIW